MSYRLGEMTDRFDLKQRMLMSVLGLALLVRALVPAGWMPTGEQAFAIAVCTGIETKTVWMDRDGTLHKSDPSEKKHEGDSKQDCGFAGTGGPAIAGYADNIALSTNFGLADPALPIAFVAIGRGLAAPPPPSTGPPVLT